MDRDVSLERYSTTSERNSPHSPVTVQVSTEEVELGIAESVHVANADHVVGLREVATSEDTEEGGLMDKVKSRVVTELVAIVG
jgi:hypothetical protein